MGEPSGQLNASWVNSHRLRLAHQRSGGAPARLGAAAQARAAPLGDPHRERVDSGLVKLLHVPDVCMPADFLTKWTTHKKVRASINYLINSSNKVYHPNDPSKPATVKPALPK